MVSSPQNVSSALTATGMKLRSLMDFCVSVFGGTQAGYLLFDEHVMTSLPSPFKHLEKAFGVPEIGVHAYTFTKLSLWKETVLRKHWSSQRSSFMNSWTDITSQKLSLWKGKMCVLWNYINERSVPPWKMQSATFSMVSETCCRMHSMRLLAE